MGTLGELILEQGVQGDVRGVNTGTGSTGGILGELILEQGVQGDARGVNTGTGSTGGC